MICVPPRLSRGELLEFLQLPQPGGRYTAGRSKIGQTCEFFQHFQVAIGDPRGVEIECGQVLEFSQLPQTGALDARAADLGTAEVERRQVLERFEQSNVFVAELAAGLEGERYDGAAWQSIITLDDPSQAFDFPDGLRFVQLVRRVHYAV